jgi:hypothetical protein
MNSILHSKKWPAELRSCVCISERFHEPSCKKTFRTCASKGVAADFIGA